MAEGISIQKDDGTWLNVAYATGAVLIAIIAWNAIEVLGIQTGWQDRYDAYFAPVKNLAAIIVGAGTWFWVQANRERYEYHLACINELRKVTWPSMADTKRMTLVVCIVVGVFAVILAGFDFIWGYLLGLLY